MFSSGPSGFQHAPISKAIVLITSVVTITAHLTSIKDSLNMPTIYSILPSFQLWRLITQLTFFTSLMESIIGILLLYKFRVIERRFGSRKFSGFVFTVYILSVLFQLAVQVILPISLVPGPYALIFACFIMIQKVPYAEQFSLFRIPFTDKTILYALGLQFLVLHFPFSLPQAVIGLIIGAVYRSELLPLHQIQLPVAVEDFCKDFIAPFFGIPRSRNTIKIFAKLQDSRRNSLHQNYFNRLNHPLNNQNMANSNNNINSNNSMMNNMNNMVNAPNYNNNNFNYPYNNNLINPGIPTEDNISSLQGMGFSRDESLYALSQTGNNLQLAMSVLLDHN